MEKLFIAFGVVFILLLTICVFALPTMWIVNALFTPHVINSIFGTSSLSFTQALLLNGICSILFKSVNPSSK